MEGKKELMRKEYFLLGVSVISLILLISVVSAAISVISPANNTKNKGYIAFNVTYINDSDFTDATNASFYYNLSGTWQLIGNVSTCTKAVAGAVASCNASLNVSTLVQGRYSINVTLANLTNFGAAYGANVTTYNVTFDYTPPSINITFPTNNSNFSSLTIEINYSRSDNLGLGACWFSNNSGQSNNTLANCVNITGKTWLAGFNNITIWVNDTVGNQNYSSVSFFLDNVKPNISIIFPANNSNTSNTQLNINYTRSDNRGITNCWFSNNSGQSNNSLGTNCVNITGKTWLAGFNNITIWVNDTVGNQNYSSVSFFLDNVKPNISIIFPANNTNSTNNNLNVNYTIEDNRGIINCWYSNDTYLKNTTLADCINITDVTWSLGFHNITVWVNDSAGNVNSSSVSFNMSMPDTTFPTATFSCSPSIINRGGTVTCSCEPSDLESGINTSVTVYQTNPSTSEMGILTVYCYFADLAGNANNLSTTYFVFDQGGGGILKPKSIPSTSDTSTEVIEKSESWTRIMPNIPEIMKDFDKEMGIKQIQIEVTGEAKNVQMTVTGYGSKPAELSASKDEAYKYLHIETKNLTEKLSKATIDIQVKKSWISENNLDKKDIALFKFNETSDKWKELPTTFKEEDSTYDYYNIELKSFSYFAIASKEVKEKKWVILIWITILVLTMVVLFFFIIRKNKIKKIITFFTNLKRKIKRF